MRSVSGRFLQIWADHHGRNAFGQVCLNGSLDMSKFNNYKTVLFDCREFQDLVDGQRSLLEIVQQQGIKVHKSLASALEHTAGILRNSSTLNGSICNKMIVQKFR